MNPIWQHFAHHLEAYGLGGGALILALIRCMPKPETLRPIIGNGLAMIIYVWIYDSLQSVIPGSSKPEHPAPPFVVTSPLTWPGQSIIVNTPLSTPKGDDIAKP